MGQVSPLFWVRPQCWQRKRPKEFLGPEEGRPLSKTYLSPLVGRREKVGANLGLVEVGFANKRLLVELLSFGGGFGARAHVEPRCGNDGEGRRAERLSEGDWSVLWTAVIRMREDRVVSTNKVLLVESSRCDIDLSTSLGSRDVSSTSFSFVIG